MRRAAGPQFFSQLPYIGFGRTKKRAPNSAKASSPWLAQGLALLREVLDVVAEKGHDLQRGQPRGRRAARDRLEAGVLVARAAVRPAQHRVADEPLRAEDRLGVRALGGGAVGDDHDLPPEGPHAGEKRGGARERDRLAPRTPGRPGHGVEGPADPRLLELVERVVEHGLVGVEDDGPGAGRAAAASRSTRAVAAR